MVVIQLFSRDVASDSDRHLDITFGLQVVERSSLVSVRFRKVFNHPYISFFHLLCVLCHYKYILCVCVCGPKKYLNCTLVIDSPFQTFEVELLVKMNYCFLQKRFPLGVNQGFSYIMHTLLYLSGWITQLPSQTNR